MSTEQIAAIRGRLARLGADDVTPPRFQELSDTYHDDITTLLAALDAVTAERDAAQQEIARLRGIVNDWLPL